MLLVFIIAELILLFILSKALTKSLSLTLQLLHFEQTFVVFIIALIFLPGTLIHELSHWLMAKILFVRTGKISLFPQLQGSTIRMGTAEVEKVDRFRQLLIGLAPFIIGMIILFYSFYFSLPKLSSFNYWMIGLFVYLLFVITNSMFSSKKDLEGATFFVIICAVIVGILFLIDKQFLQQIQAALLLVPTNYLLLATDYLLIPLVLDIIVVGVLRLLIRILL